MRRLVSKLTFAIVLGGAVSIACGDDDDSSDGHGGSAGKSGVGGKAAGGTGGRAAGGSGGTGTGTGGTGTAKGGTGGTVTGAGGTVTGAGGTVTGAGGAARGGSTSGGAANGGSTPVGGEAGSGGEFGGAGAGGTGGSGGAGGDGGAAGEGARLQIARGQYLVTAVAQCNSCHASNLGGNATFKSNGVTLPTPNLTNDATGLGGWSDTQIKNAFMNGIDDEGRQLAPAMPYWLYHNLTTADADSIVAYLRSVPKVVNALAANPAATAVTPLAPSAFPDTSLTTGADHDAAVQGKYLLTSAARCVSCHSTVTGGVPAPGFSGRAPATSGAVYPANLTPDATGTAGWVAADVSSVLLTSTMKGTTNPVCSMPRFAGLTSEDALAIGHYLTTIPPVANAAASLSGLPVLTACP